MPEIAIKKVMYIDYDMLPAPVAARAFISVVLFCPLFESSPVRGVEIVITVPGAPGDERLKHFYYGVGEDHLQLI